MKNRFREFFENDADAIYVLDAKSSRIIDCNHQASLQLGYSREEILKLKATDVEATLSPKDIDSAHSRLTDVPFVTVEGTHKRKNGTLFPVEIRLSKWIEGDSTWIISDVRDVTERKKAKEALNDELTTSATL